MKGNNDLVRGWLRRAASDVVSMEATLHAGSLDGACFHAQQAAEKYLKAFLIYHSMAFPHTHNLKDLVELCGTIDPSFHSLASQAASLTPYAVRARYDDSFWPTMDLAEEARAAALAVRDFVLLRLPEMLSNSPS
jgi:HEPN domain-containing protein